MRARLHRVFRGVGAALAVLTFASPLLGSLHEAAVRHVACPEDGELIDEPSQPPHQHGRASSDAPALFAEGYPGTTPSGQGHEHCAVLFQAHLRGREQSRKPFAVTAQHALAALRVPDGTPRLRGLVLYRLAPKASPPLC